MNIMYDRIGTLMNIFIALAAMMIRLPVADGDHQGVVQTHKFALMT
jgi:hypothetical protein